MGPSTGENIIDLNTDEGALPPPLMPTYKDEEDSGIPLDIAKCIALNLHSVSDVLSFSLVNKRCHEAVYSNDELWINYLQLLGLWNTSEYNRQKDNLIDEKQWSTIIATPRNPMNCFDNNQIIYSKKHALDQFKQIYQLMNPIFKDLIIVNRSNFANSKFLKRYDTPEEQVIIFNNLSRFMNIFKDSKDHDNYAVRFRTVVDVFSNSVLKEIETNINSQNHKECLRFIRILSKLKTNNNNASSTLDSVLEFFVDRYMDDFNFLNTNDTINSCFSSKTNKTQINYEVLGDIFEQIRTTISKEFEEVCKIFDSDPTYVSTKDDLNEVPILLKIVENFMQNVLISKFCEDLIGRALFIDEKEENIEEIKEFEEDHISNDNNIPSGEADASLENVEQEINKEEEEETTLDPSIPEMNNEWSDVTPSKLQTQLPEISEEAPKEIDQEISTKKELGIEEMSNAALYFQIVPYLYRKMIEIFHLLKYPISVVAGSGNTLMLGVDNVEKEAIRRASGSNSAPINYEKIYIELVEFYYEPFLSEFITKLPKQCNIILTEIVKNWKINQQQEEVSQTSQILDLVTSNDSKNKNFMKLDIFTGFSKIFKVGNILDIEEVNNTEHKTLTKSEANLKILTANLSNIKSLISLDLAITLLRTLKENTELLLSLTGRGNTKQNSTKKRVGEFAPPLDYNIEELKHRVNITCQEMFNDMLNILMDAHIKAGFEKALARLKNYNPSELKKTTDNTVDPIINFIELVNVGDLIQQMISVFYREELVNTKIVMQKHKTKRDFLMANKCEKSMRKFENMLDNYVADGLNISIDVLMSEISFGIMKLSNEADYNITEKDLMEKNINLGEPSKLGKMLLEILENHINLLTGTIDKTIVDVFQQEIGERFVGILVKLITKNLIISTTGAIILISDLNAYYNFFLRLKLKPVLSYFTALKSISQMYLIDSSNSKDIGKLVVKLGRENGIFNQEEIYEFVTRRSDWDLIKRDVDKIMYGLGIADCVLA